MSGQGDSAQPAERVPSGAPDPSELDHDALDRYVQRHFSGEDAVLREIRRRADRAGMPRIQLPTATARAAQVLVRAAGARRVLEVGTLAGYSAVWIARALPPHGRLITIEINADHAAVARESVAAAGVSDRVDIRLGDAVAVMSELGPDGSFDVVFLDADKERYTTYLEMAAGLLRPGGLLMADNAFWAGRVLDPDSNDLAAELDRFNRVVSVDDRFDATILPVGDGLLLAVRR